MKLDYRKELEKRTRRRLIITFSLLGSGIIFTLMFAISKIFLTIGLSIVCISPVITSILFKKGRQVDELLAKIDVTESMLGFTKQLCEFKYQGCVKIKTNIDELSSIRQLKNIQCFEIILLVNSAKLVHKILSNEIDEPIEYIQQVVMGTYKQIFNDIRVKVQYEE